MAKNRVKGITVQIGGDVTGLDKALKDTNKNISNTQSQLKDVERLLKLDPKNTVLLGQKQRLLASAVEDTNEKLKQLTEAHDQAVGNLGNYDAWAHANDKIQDEIDQTRDALRKLEKQKTQMDEAGQVDTDEYKQLTAEIEKTTEEAKRLKKHAEDVRKEFGNPLSPEQFDSLQREIIETRQELEKMEQTGKVSLEAISDKAGKVADTFKPVTTAVAGVAAAAVATVPATEELREKLSLLDANAMESAVGVDAARDAWKKFAIQSGDTGSAVEATSNLLQAGFTESNLQRAVEGLAGAAVRFPDTLKVESLADSLQETLATGAATGQFSELIERLGLNLDEFNAAMEACTTDAERQNLALQTLADAGLNDSYEAWKKNNEEMLANKEANLNLELSMAKIAETILPVVTEVTTDIAKLIEWFAKLPDGAKFGIAAFAGLAASISPVAGTVSNVMGLLDKLSNANLPGLGGALGKISGTALPGLQGAFSSVFSWIAANPIVLLIAAVALFGDQIQEILGVVNDFLQGLFVQDWTEVFGPVLGGVLNGFFAQLKDIWDAVYQILNGVIDFIRGFFTLDMERAWNGVVQVIKGVWDGLVTILKAPINAAIQYLNRLIDSFNWVSEKVNSVFGTTHVPIRNIPYLADGGEVLRGSAIVGDAGPELLTVLGDRTVVQPLTTNNTYRSTALGGVNVNVYGAPGQDARELAEMVSEEIQRMVESEEAKL